MAARIRPEKGCDLLRMADGERVLPKPIVAHVKVNGRTIRALLDTGSMVDLLSTAIANQLSLSIELLERPLPVQLAVHAQITVEDQSLCEGLVRV